MPDQFETICDALVDRAIRHADREAFVFLRNGEEQGEVLTYGMLLQRALAVSESLRGIAPGSRVVLSFPPGADFIIAFFGTLLAGVISVPVASLRRDSGRLRSVTIDCDASAVIAPGKLLQRFIADLSDLPTRFISFEDLVNIADLRRPDIPHTPENIAMLQYTSGSTGEPKGVVLTHANIMSNQAYITERFGHPEGFKGVTWLPMFHDMGLIGGVIHPVFLGGTAVMMSPLAFLQSPLRWLKAIEKYQAYSSGAPNFAYDLCAMRVTDKEAKSLSLDCWKVAFVGAEPIQSITMRRFSEKFAHSGFSKRSLIPCYGLAEATLMVTAADRRDGCHIEHLPQESFSVPGGSEPVGPASTLIEAVSSGRVLGDVDVKIVDSAGTAVVGRSIPGEICVSGPNVSERYWGTTQRQRRIVLKNDAGDNVSYLRTGDLGLIRKGQLFVVGRLDDLIVINGRNVFPHDIESAVSDQEVVNSHRSAAFAVTAESGHRFVLACEKAPRLGLDESTAKAAIQQIRAAVLSRCDVILTDILIVPEGAIPMTTSGKVRRKHCREIFRLSDFMPIAIWSSTA